MQRLVKYCNLNSVAIKSDDEIEIKISRYHHDKTVSTSTMTCNQNYSTINFSNELFITIQTMDSVKTCVQLTIYAKPIFFNNIKLAHVICTYRNNPLVIEKINKIPFTIDNNYHLFIIDNGNTIDYDSNEKVTIITSPNYGGSAGFTRGIIESINNDYTHILLNDDDAIYEYESIFRTISFYSLVNPKYQDICLSGICLDKDCPNIVYDAGGVCKKNTITLLNRDMDITEIDDIITLFEEKRIDYSAWTYACFSTSIFKKKGLPLPMFFQYDDVEYGIRSKVKNVTIPGIFVLHHRSTGIRTNIYYSTRNSLITALCHKQYDYNDIDKLFNMILAEMAAYRYDYVKKEIKAIKDVLKGPDYVFMLCKKGPIDVIDNLKTDKIENLRKLTCVTNSNYSRKKIVKIITLNGLILPSLGDLETDQTDYNTSHFYRIKKVLYPVDKDFGFITKRSFKKTITLLVEIVLLKQIMKMKIHKISKKYNNSISHYSSMDFWLSLLGQTKHT